MTDDTSVRISQATADALTRAEVVGDVHTWEQPERVAWILYVIKEWPDEEALFPRGKWATIQALEEQVQRAAERERPAR